MRPDVLHRLLFRLVGVAVVVDDVGPDVLLLKPVPQGVAKDQVLGVTDVHEDRDLGPVVLLQDGRQDAAHVTLAVRKPRECRVVVTFGEDARIPHALKRIALVP